MLPALFQPHSVTLRDYRKSDGVTSPHSEIVEPGEYVDNALHDEATGHFPPVVQISDFEPTGTFASSALWTLTITPVTDQNGNAAAALAMAAESVTFQANASTKAQVVAGLVAAVTAATTTTTLSASATWKRIGSYIKASISPVSSDKLRITARNAGAVFSATLTSSVVGDTGPETVITAPIDFTLKVGFYVALDTTKGTNGYDKNGRPYFKKVTSATPASQIFGPIYLGADTEPVESGFAYREYNAGSNIPYVLYGHPAVYADKVITLASGPEAVYVRHTDSGDFLAGMASDAAGAAAGATANEWTWTPTAVDSTLYQVQISIGTVNEVIAFTSGVGTTATLICNGLRANLLTKQSLTGLVAGTGTTTLILTGPADGREVTVANVGPGAAASVTETTPEVNTHTLLTRGDKFIQPNKRIGAAAVDVPVTYNS